MNVPIRRATVVLICCAGGCLARPARVPDRVAIAPGPARIDPEALLPALLEAHNEARAASGLAPLTLDPALDAAARGHVRAMAERRRLSHRGRGGSSPFDRIEAQGYRFRAAAENVAYGQSSVETLMKDWLRSPGHRRNILGNFTQIGAGGATDATGVAYWCVTFGTPR